MNEEVSIENIIADEMNKKIDSISLIDLSNIKDNKNWSERINPTNKMDE